MRTAILATLSLTLLLTLVLRTDPFPVEEGSRGGAPLGIDPHTLSSRAALIYDLRTGTVLFGHNEERQLPLASVAKLATVAYALAQGNNRTLTLAPEDIGEEGDSGLMPGEQWELFDLARFVLRTSSNDAAAAVAGAFRKDTRSLTSFVRSIGLSQTYFLNPTGLDISTTTAGAYGSARDMALLLSYLMKHDEEVLSATARFKEEIRDLSGAPKEEGATTALLEDIPGLIGAKTGFTDLAGGNLAVVVDRGFERPLAIVVLGASRESRFSDVRALLEAVYLEDAR